MSDTKQAAATTAERGPYATPVLSRHGSLDALARGAGTKQIEKGSVRPK